MTKKKGGGKNAIVFSAIYRDPSVFNQFVHHPSQHATNAAPFIAASPLLSPAIIGPTVVAIGPHQSRFHPAVDFDFDPDIRFLSLIRFLLATYDDSSSFSLSDCAYYAISSYTPFSVFFFGYHDIPFTPRYDGRL